MDVDAYRRAADVGNVRNSSLLRGRALENAEIVKLFATCTDTLKGARDAAVSAVLFGCGLRQGELARLDVEDFDTGDCSIVVNGKDDKQRRVYLTEGGCRYVEAWLEHRGDSPALSSVRSVRRGGRITRLRGSSA